MKINTTWGRNISTKFYLNTNLKPMTVGDRKNIYPLYVRVICKQQVSQFKYFGKDLEPSYFSQEEFSKSFGDINLNSDNEAYLRNKAVGVTLLYSFKKDVDFVLNIITHFFTSRLAVLADEDEQR